MSVTVNWCKIAYTATDGSDALDYNSHLADGKYPLMFDLEECSYPNQTARYHACPAMTSIQNYLVRCPYDINLSFDSLNGLNVSRSAHLAELIKPADEPYSKLKNPYFQLNVSYMFWAEKETYLFLDDPMPQYHKPEKNWYILGGMLPIHKIYRHTHAAIIMREYRGKFEIKREDPLYNIRLFSPHGRIKLKQTEPSPKIMAHSLSMRKAIKFCPYTWSRKMFSNWSN